MMAASGILIYAIPNWQSVCKYTLLIKINGAIYVKKEKYYYRIKIL